MSKRRIVTGLLALSLVAAFGSSAFAGVVRVGPGGFTPLASTITFSEPGKPVGTVNPHYSFVTASLGVVDVDFDGWFDGQTGAGSPVTLTDHTPTGPLTLLAASPNTFITTDGANPTSPVLSGTPTYNGVISILFSTNVGAVGLDGGYFDAAHSTTIEAYDENGNVLGSVTNNGTGIEFFGLADAGGLNTIRGISFFITGAEPAGFAIDNVTFGSAREVVGVAPLPSSALLGLSMLGGLVGIGALRRRKRQVIG